MKVTNNLPTVQIVAETKINPQSINSFMKKSKVASDWNEETHKRNLNSTLSDVEKLPEAVFFLNNKHKKSTEEFNKTIDINLLKATSITLGLNNVSKQFVFELNQLNKNFEIASSDFDKDEISFWVNPCLLDDKEATYYFGRLLAETSEQVDKLREHIEGNTKGTAVEKDKVVKRLIPVASQVHCLVTGSLYDWYTTLTAGTDFDKLDELRFVLIEITRKLKLKYTSIFYNFVLSDSEGNEFGLDTVNSVENGWRKYKVVTSSSH